MGITNQAKHNRIAAQIARQPRVHYGAANMLRVQCGLPTKGKPFARPVEFSLKHGAVTCARCLASIGSRQRGGNSK